MPFEPEAWLADRKVRMSDALRRLARAAKAGAIPGGSIEDGVLKIDRLTAAVPDESEAMVLDLYARLPFASFPLVCGKRGNGPRPGHGDRGPILLANG